MPQYGPTQFHWSICQQNCRYRWYLYENWQYYRILYNAVSRYTRNVYELCLLLHPEKITAHSILCIAVFKTSLGILRWNSYNRMVNLHLFNLFEESNFLNQSISNIQAKLPMHILQGSDLQYLCIPFLPDLCTALSGLNIVHDASCDWNHHELWAILQNIKHQLNYQSDFCKMVNANHFHSVNPIKHTWLSGTRHHLYRRW